MKNKKRIQHLFLVSLLSFFGAFFSISAQKSNENILSKKRLIFEDNFSEKKLSDKWVVEKNDKDSIVATIVKNQLELNSKHGLTVWYKVSLKDNILIEFDREVIVNRGANDRLGDCNQFWMANDSTNKMFSRKGGFAEYDSLNLYYVGFGAHDNTLTRMRRYNGSNDREIAMKDLTDIQNLLMPNKKYHIQIMVTDGVSTFRVDGKVFFSFKDPKPYKEGWFGFRSFQSHQKIDNLKIWQL